DTGIGWPAADEAQSVALAIADADLIDPYLVLGGNDGTGRRIQILWPSDGVVEAGRRSGDVHATSGDLGIAEGDDGDVAGDQIRGMRWLGIWPARVEGPAVTHDIRLVGVGKLERDVRRIWRLAIDAHASHRRLGSVEAGRVEDRQVAGRTFEAVLILILDDVKRRVRGISHDGTDQSEGAKTREQPLPRHRSQSRN